MQLRYVGLLASVLLVGLACEMEWGKGGFVDRAMAKDVRELVPEDCEAGEVWGRSVRAPKDCQVNDPRDACQKKCRPPGK